MILDSETDIQSLSDATLHISFRSPKGINLTVVDIPGLVTGLSPLMITFSMIELINI